MQQEQLRTLAAIVDEESFEGAADALRITPSAVSQRIKALEAHVGRVVVERTSPARPTAAGEVLLRLARQQELLQIEAWDELGGRADADARGTAARSQGEAPARFPLAVAVNADSLATWFRDVVEEAATWPDITLRLVVDDQDHTADLLRQGKVLAGISSNAAPVGGCAVHPLGVMRYVAVATADLAAAHGWRPGHRAARIGWETLPVVRFNARDTLQEDFLKERGHRSGPVHEVPSPEVFAQAVRWGLGWGLLPEAQLGDSLRSGELVRLAADPVDVPLHWQAWRMSSTRLSRLSDAVRAATTRRLRPC